MQASDANGTFRVPLRDTAAETPKTCGAIQFDVRATVVNALSSAYTSSGYPTFVNNGSSRSVVYGAFVEMRNPSMHTLTMPPRETVIQCQRESLVNVNSGNSTTLPPPRSSALVRVIWHRGAHLLPINDLAQLAMSMTSPKMQPSNTSNAGSSSIPIGANNGNTAAAAAAAGRPTSASHHLRQFPEGIHNIVTSPRLRELLLELPPTSQCAGASDTTNTPPPPPPTATTTTTTTTTTTRAAAGEGDSAIVAPQGEEKGAPKPVTPPPEEEPSGTAPVQLTLVTASSFNHLTTYAVRHQASRVLASIPLQTLSASIYSRKITANALFLIGSVVNEGYKPSEELQPLRSSEVQPPRSRKPGLKSTNTTNLGISASEAHGLTTLRFESLPLAASRDGEAEDKVITMHMAVEPYLILGNQSGDLFIFGIVAEKILYRLNFSGGVHHPSAQTGGGCGNNNGGGPQSASVFSFPFSSSPSPVTGMGCGSSIALDPSNTSQIVCSAVSTIAMVQCGVERHLRCVTEKARLAKQKGETSFTLPCNNNIINSNNTNNNTNGSSFGFIASESIFAAGFDNGHVLLVVVTLDGAWLSRHITTFGQLPIWSIAPQAPDFFLRLWSSQQEDVYPLNANPNKHMSRKCAKDIIEASATSTCIYPETATTAAGSGNLRMPSPCRVYILTYNLFGEEEMDLAAVSCSGGALCLVRTPSMEILSHARGLANHAVGDFITLQWVPSTAEATHAPDFLIATSEDDTMTLYQLPRNATSAPSRSHGPSQGPRVDEAEGTGGWNERHSASSNRECLVAMDRHRFHDSWVHNVCAVPLPRGQSHHALLIASSYDGRTSFWPIGSETPRTPTTSRWEEATFPQCFSEYLVQDGSALFTPSQAALTAGVTVSLPSQPTLSIPLHDDLTIRCAVGGAGNSYFLTSLCLRGKVKFWQMSIV